MILFGDLETYSEKPLNQGTYAYAEACEILLFAYAIDDGPVWVWDLTENRHDGDMPYPLFKALSEADEVVFQNSMFDRTVMRCAANTHPVMRDLAADVPRWRDTMVQALAHSLPGGLEKLCEVLNVEQDKRKLATGKALVQLFCKPRPKTSKLRRATRETHPIEWAQFVEYAAYDIHAMREVRRKCPRWNYRGDELALWHLDQRINDRGVCVDLDLANAAIEATLKEQARLKDTAQEMTAGYVESTTKRDKLLEYLLMEYGVDLPNLQKDTLERRVNDPDLPVELRDLLAVRLMASTASTAKYKTLVRGVSGDGRLRGLLQFDGAARTGRWAGRLFQPQNLPRPDMDQEEIDQCIEALLEGSLDLVASNVMRACANVIRGSLVAPPGKKLVVADLANIEGRMAAWLAGEAWKLQAFRDYDAGTGPDLYKVAYAKAFAILVEAVTKPMRQIGKVMELMLQYEGGVGAFITGAATYGIDLDAMAEAALPCVPSDVLAEAWEFHAWTEKKRRSTFGLAPGTFVACDALKRLWRRAHPAISSYWGDLKETVIRAINRPGESFPARRLSVRREGAWLKIQLPSGRLLCYPSPQADEKGQISYMGVNPYSRKWTRIKTYGGKFFENITQAAARDVLAYGMPLVEAAGYQIVLTVHDEIISEAPDAPEYNAEHLAAIMATVPPWAKGLPLAAAGFESYRYRKE